MAMLGVTDPLGHGTLALGAKARHISYNISAARRKTQVKVLTCLLASVK